MKLDISKTNGVNLAGVPDKPNAGIITETIGASPFTPSGGQAMPGTATTPTNVSYRVLVNTNRGSFEFTARPSQRRWDVACYVAQPGDIARLYWYGDVVFFTVLEIPVTEACTTTTPGTGPGTMPELINRIKVANYFRDSAVDIDIGGEG